MIIKFRAKEKGTGQWQFWDYPHQQMPPLHIEFSTVGQFVNIHDVDKNEIYVGDILEDELNRRWIVFDAPGGFCVCTIEESSETNNNPSIYSALGEPQNASWTAQNCKVIGNRYDHPELLAGGKNEN